MALDIGEDDPLRHTIHYSRSLPRTNTSLEESFFSDFGNTKVPGLRVFLREKCTIPFLNSD
jgi:hypothetical protein